MTSDIIIVLSILAAGFILFIAEVFTIDVTAVLLLSVLMGLGFLKPEEAIEGLSNPAVITIGLLFVLSHALQKTRVLEYLLVKINRVSSFSKNLANILYFGSTGFASALVNNTAVVAIFIPITIRMAQRYGISPSKLLIPLSYSAILGGTLTLVGTSTNLLVNSIYVNSGPVKALGMFEFTKYGIIIMGIGLLYILFVAPKLLPSRTTTASLTKSYHLGGYLTEMKVTSESPLIGSTCMDRGINANYDVVVLDIQREGKMITNFIRLTRLEEGDVLFVKGTIENFLRMKEVEKVALLTDVKLTQDELEQENNILVELLLTNQSDMVGKNLKETNFRRRFGTFILAIRREGTIFRKKIAHVVLNAFDTLLIYGPENKIQDLSKSTDFIMIGEVEGKLRKKRFWWMSITVMIFAILAAAFNILPIFAGCILAVTVLLILGVITSQESYQSINWQVIILIAALIPVGTVMKTSGTADWIGNFISSIAMKTPENWRPRVILGLIYLIAMILTEVSSNAATAVIMTPVAIAVSNHMGLDARPFVLAVAFAASASFLTPVGYQTNLMVYGPGGYKFSDYIRVGFPLAILFWITAILLLPIIWPVQQ